MMTKVLTENTAFWVYGWPYEVVISLWNKWKLQYDYTNKQLLA